MLTTTEEKGEWKGSITYISSNLLHVGTILLDC